jgi:hypothetical protein
VALNMHGTRAVQKLIETLSSREQREIVIEALKDGVCARLHDLCRTPVVYATSFHNNLADVAHFLHSLPHQQLRGLGQGSC